MRSTFRPRRRSGRTPHVLALNLANAFRVPNTPWLPCARAPTDLVLKVEQEQPVSVDCGLVLASL